MQFAGQFSVKFKVSICSNNYIFESWLSILQNCNSKYIRINSEKWKWLNLEEESSIRSTWEGSCQLFWEDKEAVGDLSDEVTILGAPQNLCQSSRSLHSKCTLSPLILNCDCFKGPVNTCSYTLIYQWKKKLIKWSFSRTYEYTSWKVFNEWIQWSKKEITFKKILSSKVTCVYLRLFWQRTCFHF